jgi:hypothetical protein
MRQIVCVSVLLSSGCYRYAKTDIIVQDAETLKPVRHAWIECSYDTEMFKPGPPRASTSTGPDGIAHIRIANDPFGVFISISADGYKQSRLSIFPRGSQLASASTAKERPWPYPPIHVKLEPNSSLLFRSTLSVTV